MPKCPACLTFLHNEEFPWIKGKRATICEKCMLLSRIKKVERRRAERQRQDREWAMNICRRFDPNDF